MHREIARAEGERLLKLRAAAHIATGADGQSEILLSWLARPASLATATIANDPIRAHEVLALLLAQWPELSKTDSLREEAEDAVMTIVHAACRSPAGPRTLPEFLNVVAEWLSGLRYRDPGHWCWTRAQKATVARILDRFKEQHSNRQKALEDHLAGKDATQDSRASGL